ncbi:MAG: ABC transporter substrate-binding protein, partial [Halobacteria archaeon]|nr:ABC transporter substrate-binding protein [Halobacteria archaeon]
MRFGLLMCLIIALAACAPPPDDVIRLGIASEPANLDPRFATDATSVRINRLLYRRLVDFDARIRPVASLASWQVLAPDHY